MRCDQKVLEAPIVVYRRVLAVAGGDSAVSEVPVPAKGIQLLVRHLVNILAAASWLPRIERLACSSVSHALTRTTPDVRTVTMLVLRTPLMARSVTCLVPSQPELARPHRVGHWHVHQEISTLLMYT